jgi:ATP-dependent DNA ligase
LSADSRRIRKRSPRLWSITPDCLGGQPSFVDLGEFCIPACVADDGGKCQTAIRFAGLDFEITLDGYRAITVFDESGKTHLWSRYGLRLEAKFPAIATAVSELKLRSTILDGEIVAVDENGIPRFQLPG